MHSGCVFNTEAHTIYCMSLTNNLKIAKKCVCFSTEHHPFGSLFGNIKNEFENHQDDICHNLEVLNETKKCKDASVSLLQRFLISKQFSAESSGLLFKAPCLS